MKALMCILLLSLIFCTFGSTACKKDNDGNNDSDTTGIVFLRDASLNKIHSTLSRNWKIHYKYGGFTGRQKVELPNTHLKFLSNDSIYIIDSDVPIVADKIGFIHKQTEFGYTAILYAP